MLRSGRCLLNSRQRCLYELLGVSRVATTEEIDAAYKKREQIVHPNAWPRASKIYSSPPQNIRELQQVAQAYAILRDDATRRKYDIKLEGTLEESVQTTPRTMLLGLGLSLLFAFDAIIQKQQHSKVALASHADMQTNLELVRMALD